MNNRQIKVGVILSYVSVFLTLIISLTYTPFMIRALGQSEYGLYQTAASAISMLSLLNLGLGSSYVRFYIREKSVGTSDGVARLNGMFFSVFSVLGMIALLCGLFMSNNVKLVFSDGLTPVELQKAKKLMLLLTVNLAISFPMSVFSSIITANERFIFQKVLLLIQQVASPLLNIPLLLMGYTSVGIVVVTVILSVVIWIANIVFCIKVLHIKFLFSKMRWHLFKEVVVFTSFIAVNLIVDQINWNIDKILLGRYWGTVAVSIYSIGAMFNTIYISFSTSVSHAFTPRVHQIWNDTSRTESERNQDLTNLFISVGRIQLIILLLVCSGFLIFGRQFIALWVGSGFENAYWVTLCLIVPVTLPLSQNVGIEIQRAKNKHQFRSYLYAGMALINFALSVYLGQRYGEVGCAIGTAISLLVANGLCMNIYYQTVLRIEVSGYWKVAAQVCLILIIPMVSGIILCRIFSMGTWFSLIAAIFVYTCIYGISMLLFAFERNQRELYLRWIYNKLVHRV